MLATKEVGDQVKKLWPGQFLPKGVPVRLQLRRACRHDRSHYRRGGYSAHRPLAWRPGRPALVLLNSSIEMVGNLAPVEAAGCTKLSRIRGDNFCNCASCLVVAVIQEETIYVLTVDTKKPSIIAL